MTDLAAQPDVISSDCFEDFSAHTVSSSSHGPCNRFVSLLCILYLPMYLSYFPMLIHSNKWIVCQFYAVVHMYVHTQQSPV